MSTISPRTRGRPVASRTTWTRSRSHTARRRVARTRYSRSRRRRASRRLRQRSRPRSGPPPRCARPSCGPASPRCRPWRRTGRPPVRQEREREVSASASQKIASRLSTSSWNRSSSLNVPRAARARARRCGRSLVPGRGRVREGGGHARRQHDQRAEPVRLPASAGRPARPWVRRSAGTRSGTCSATSRGSRRAPRSKRGMPAATSAGIVRVARPGGEAPMMRRDGSPRSRGRAGRRRRPTRR